MVNQPVVIGVRGDVRPLVWVHTEVEHQWYPQIGERVRPDQQGSGSPLLHEDKFPIVVAQSGQLLVVVDVQERDPRALLGLARQIGDEIVTVQICLPTLPNRGSTVVSSLSEALQSNTPRGPNLARKAGSFG
jgi:hypothetical protein